MTRSRNKQAKGHLLGQDAEGLGPVWGSMWIRRVKAGRSRGRGGGGSGGGWEPGVEDGRAPGQREARAQTKEGEQAHWRPGSGALAGGSASTSSHGLGLTAVL
jgi:hypothetical protein